MFTVQTVVMGLMTRTYMPICAEDVSEYPQAEDSPPIHEWISVEGLRGEVYLRNSPPLESKWLPGVRRAT